MAQQIPQSDYLLKKQKYEKRKTPVKDSANAAQ